MSFELINVTNISCKGEGAFGAVTLTNVSGDPTEDFFIEVFRTGEATPIYTKTLPAVSINGFVIDEDEIELIEDSYQVVISQQQDNCTERITAAAQQFIIDEPTAPFGATLGEVTISLPDQPTGSIAIIEVAGGTTAYEARIELINPTFPGDELFIDWQEIAINPQSLEFEILFEELYPGEYQIDLRDANGCTLSFEVLVPFNTDIFIPNVFTPNGDGINDTFFIRNLPIEGNTMAIQNRWGRVVFEATDYKGDWDGGNLPDGVYFYTLQINGGDTFKGWVEILGAVEPD